MSSKKRVIAGAVTVLVIVGSTMIGAGAAFADDGPPPPATAAGSTATDPAVPTGTDPAADAPAASTGAPAATVVDPPAPDPVVAPEPVDGAAAGPLEAPAPAPAPAPVAAAPDGSAPEAAAAPTGEPPAAAAAVDPPRAPAADAPEGKKVWVCKYVGKPGVDERLKGGKNPISVAVSSIQNNEWDGTVPGWFSDAQDRSFVLAYDDGGPAPDASACAPPVPGEDAVAQITIVPATCESPAILEYSTIVNATFSGTADGTAGPASYAVTATALAGHVFSSGEETTMFEGVLAGPIPSQSTDPEGRCYVPPTEVATASVRVLTAATCDAPSTVAFTSENATAVGEPDLSPGAHHLVFQADAGALFAGRSGTFTVDYTIDPPLPPQSTDPGAPCYVAPPVPPQPPVPPVPPAALPAPAAVVEAGGGLAVTGAEPPAAVVLLGVGGVLLGAVALFATRVASRRRGL